MQATFKSLFSLLFCLTLTLLGGCRSEDLLTSAEQMKADKILADSGKNSIADYITNHAHKADMELVLKYLKYFVSKGADVGDTALSAAVESGNVEIVKFLASKGAIATLANINVLNSSRSGHLVYATGTAVTEDVLEDTIFGISTNAISFERAVEYYQWVEDKRSETRQKLGGGEETVTIYTYRQDWVTRPVDSSRFSAPNTREENKNTVIANIEYYAVRAENVSLGAYKLPKFLANSIHKDKDEPFTVELSNEVIVALTQQIAPNIPPSAAPAVHVNGSTVYLGSNPGLPSIGDIRVTFTRTAPSVEVSLIAQVVDNTFEAFRTQNGTRLATLKVGVHSAENMVTLF